MIENVSFPSPTGVTVNAALALPAGDAKGPAVVVLHEWWGLNAHVRTLLSRLADAGFAALAPDLYHGQVATNPADAHRLMTELQWSVALDEIAGAKAFLEAHPRAGAKVGVTGFCMGGAGALATACNVPGVAAAVMFYGIPPAHYTPWATADVPPIQAHVSSRDPWVTVAAATAIHDALSARGRTFDLHVYDAEHAFVNDTRPDVYSPECAALAWSRMLAFFRTHLA
jgi:carboxymethylenebutenolidase